jgi:hypothetical protein
MDQESPSKKKIFLIVGGIIVIITIIGLVLTFTLLQTKKIKQQETDLELAQTSLSEESGSKCDRILNCLHDGTFNHKTCECVCSNDWKGRRCAIPLWQFGTGVSATLGLNDETGMMTYPPGMNLEECKQTCEDDVNCEAFTYYPIYKDTKKSCFGRSYKAVSKPWMKFTGTEKAISGKKINRKL